MKDKVLHFIKLYLSIYFILYIIPFPLFGFPLIFEEFFVWFGQNILGLKDVQLAVTGSGDTLLDYVKLIIVVSFSLILSILFLFTSSAFREKIFLFSITYTRFFLSFILLSYGVSKFGNGQFSPPNLYRLNQSVGEMSPMGILWTFMGSSAAYSTFGGICQVTAGLLLLYRKTLILGAIIAFGVMTNVMVLNYCYDVPVKLFSTNLVLMSLFIIYKNGYQIIRFLMGKPAKIHFYGFRFKKRWLQISSKVLIVLFILTFTIGMSFSRIFNTKEGLNQNFDAIYTKESTNSIDSLSTDLDWDKFIIEDNLANIFQKNGDQFLLEVSVDEQEKTFFFKTFDSTKTDFNLQYKLITPDTIELYHSEDTIGKFKLSKKEDFELYKRDFHWITEYPYNR